MSIRIPEPKKNGDKLLVWWLQSSATDRRLALISIFLYAFIWLGGVYFAPEYVIEIGRLAGWEQVLAALSMGAMSLVWNVLVVTGYVVDSAQTPSSLWLLLTWIGPAGVVYIIWLLHQETWPGERPLAWIWGKWEKRPRWLHRRRKERFKDGYEVLHTWEQLMAHKEPQRQRPVFDEAWFYGEEPKPPPPEQTAVRNSSPPLPQSSIAPSKPSVKTETAVEEKSCDEENVQSAKKSLGKPVQLPLLMVETGEKSEDVKEEVAERPVAGNERKRRPGRPGSGRRRWRR